MPLTIYTSAQEGLLSSFSSIPNFRAKKFTFYNKLTGDVVIDAISMDDNGRLLFKDKQTQIYFDELINKKQYIVDEINEYDEQILYFQDEFNDKISLGQIYDNIQRFINSNLVFWHHDRVSKSLSGGLDRYIIENIYTSYQTISIEDNITVKDFVTARTDIWKNKWMDIPCMQVVTPEYVNGCVANITAKVSMKLRNDKPLYTGFRLIDGTTGLELTRTIHASRGQHGKTVTYTIPLSYQGPLPDSEPSIAVASDVITYNDIQNLTFEPNNNEFSSTPLDPKTTSIQQSKHVIKLQWITCDIASEIMLSGEVTESLVREFDPDGNTSIEINIFSSNSTTTDIAEINGIINFDDVKENEYVYKFDTIPFGLEKGYTLNLSSNKNVNLSVLSRDMNGFIISTNRKPSGLIVDWSISYNVNVEVDLNTLNDTSRVLNHFLFKTKEESIDFCDELLKRGKYTRRVPSLPANDPTPCACCDCCTEDAVDVIFSPLGGGGLSCWPSPFGYGDCAPGATYTWTKPYVYVTDRYGNEAARSSDLNYFFYFMAQIAVSAGGSGGGGGVEEDIPDVYDFFSDLFSTAGNTGLSEGVDIIYASGGSDSINLNKSPSAKKQLKQESSNCQYSFEPDAYVTSKIVGEGASVSVYKLLSPGAAIICTAPDDEIGGQAVGIIASPITDYSNLQVYSTVSEVSVINRFSNEFSQNLLYGGILSTTSSELRDNMNKINNIKQLGLTRLKYDKLSKPNDLPAQPVSSNLIRLDLVRNSSFDIYFENSNSPYLYVSNGANTKSFINPNDGYLSILAFRHNLLSFDPNPGMNFSLEQNYFFPTFDPIGNKKSLQEILEYIYTAIYPIDNVPVFPNFRVGDVVINGSLYNPLYDYRNFRTFGVYQVFKNNTINESVFISNPVSMYIQGLRIGKIVKNADKYYQVKRDFNNTSPIFTSISSSGVIQKVIPSGIIFKRVTQELFDLNPSLQVTI
jgi:hypothetical protein